MRRWLVRVLREHAIFATNADAVVPTHGTTQRIAYGSPNHPTDYAAERGAHSATERTAYSHAECNSNGASDRYADQHATAPDASPVPAQVQSRP